MSDEGPAASASAAGPAPAVELVVPTPYANAASKIITYLPYKIMHGKQREAARACWRIPTRDALHTFKKLEDGGIRSSLLGGTEVVAQGQFWAHGGSSQAWSLMAAALRELETRFAVKWHNETPTVSEGTLSRGGTLIRRHGTWYGTDPPERHIIKIDDDDFIAFGTPAQLEASATGPSLESAATVRKGFVVARLLQQMEANSTAPDGPTPPTSSTSSDPPTATTAGAPAAPATGAAADAQPEPNTETDPPAAPAPPAAPTSPPRPAAEPPEPPAGAGLLSSELNKLKTPGNIGAAPASFTGHSCGANAICCLASNASNGNVIVQSTIVGLTRDFPTGKPMSEKMLLNLLKDKQQPRPGPH